MAILSDHNALDMIERSVNSDDLPRTNFTIVDSDVVETQPYVGVMREISIISQKMNWVQNYDQYPTRRFEYPFAYLATPLSERMTVMDAGCSIDPFAPFLSSKGLITYGVDNFASHDVPWDPHLGIFQGRYTGLKKMQIYGERLRSELKISVNYHNNDMASTDFSSQSFDRIFCISVIEHLPKYKVRVVFDEWRRILHRDGLLVVTIDYIVDGVPKFNIGKMLTGTGFVLQNNISLFCTPTSSVVVAGFVAQPELGHQISNFSKIYRKSAFTRVIIDQVHKKTSRVAKGLEVSSSFTVTIPSVPQLGGSVALESL